MIHKEHDFTVNFCCAVGYDEDFHLNEIIIDELARVIVEDKKEIVSLLRSENVNVTVNDSDKVIKNAVVKEIANGNDTIANGISQMIIKKQFDEEKYNSFISAIGKKDKSGKSGKFKEKLFGALKDENVQEGAANLIAAGLKKAFNRNKKTETIQNDAELDERLKVNEARQKEKLDWKKIALIFAGIGVGAFIIIRLIKSRQQQSV